MAKINITGKADGRTWMLCEAKGCKHADGAYGVRNIMEMAQQHLADQHAGDTRTHRIEMDAEHLAALLRQVSAAAFAQNGE